MAISYRGVALQGAGFLTVACIAMLGPSVVLAQTTEPHSDSTPHVKALTASVSALREQVRLLSEQPTTTPASHDAISWCLNLERSLIRGSRGTDVHDLQEMLAQDPALYKGEPTGYFGPATQAAVIRFQERFAIATSSDGSVGPLTRAFLRSQCFVSTSTAPKVASTTPTAPTRKFWQPLERVLRWFTNTSSSTSIKTPTVVSLEGPATLIVDQAGEWTIVATDPTNSSLSYEVHWGDSSLGTSDQAETSATSTILRHTFTHADTYTIIITVHSSAGVSTQVSTPVTVLTASVDAVPAVGTTTSTKTQD